MDRFIVRKAPSYMETVKQTIEFCDFCPDKEHLESISGGKYSLEEVTNYASTEDTTDFDDIDDLIDSLNSGDINSQNKAEKALEEAGIVNVGNLYLVDVPVVKKSTPEYFLYYEYSKSMVLIIAYSSSKTLLDKYKDLVDNEITRMKVKLIINSDKSKLTNLRSFLADMASLGED